MTRAPALSRLPESYYGASNRALSIAKGLIAYERCGRNADAALREVHDDRAAVNFLQRVATTIASPSSVTQLSENVVQTAVDILGPANAAGAVFSRAVQVSFSRENSVWVPGLAADSSHVSFIGTGNPLRILQYDVSKGCTLQSGYKLGFCITVTDELIARSNAAELLRLKMQEDIGAGLDALLFSNAAASVGVSPAGLLNGVQTVTASSASDAIDALCADLGGLAEKVGGVGGEIVYVGHVKDITRIQARLPFFKNLYSSGAVTAGNLIAIACRGICVAGSADGARFDQSGESVLHMEQDAPLAISTGGAIAYPLTSLFQTQTTAIRLVLPDLCWGQRVAAGANGCVAALTGSIKW